MSNQIVVHNDKFSVKVLSFNDAVSFREQMRNRKKIAEKTLEKLEKDIEALTRGIENSCEHKWVKVVNVDSRGQQEQYCTVCFKHVILNGSGG